MIPRLGIAVAFAWAGACLAAPFACETSVPAPAYVRAEGLTELMADIGLTCDGDVPASGVQKNVELYFNTNAIGSPAEGPPLLLIGTGAGGWRTGENVLSGTREGGNRLRWTGVPLAPAGRRGPFRFRFGNLRLSAGMLGESATIRPAMIVFMLQIEGVEVRSPQRFAAVVTPPTTARVTACNGRDTAQRSYSQATALNSSLLAKDGAGDSMQFSVRFAEPFEGAFRPLVAGERSRKSTFADAPTEGVEFLGVPGMRGATHGTRFLIRFANIPAGVEVYVTTERMLPGLGTSDTIQANLAGFMLNGAGPRQEVEEVKVTNCGRATLAVARVPLTEGAGAAVWEIGAADPNELEEVSFGVALAYRADPKTGTPGLGAAVMMAGLAPVSTITGTGGSGPVPRFVDRARAVNLFRIEAPVTRLLFPIVTNQAGYNTTIVLTNTGEAVGECVLNFAGNIIGQHPAPKPMRLAQRFAPGSPVRLELYEVAPGFQGCIRADCYVTSAEGAFSIAPGPNAPAEISGKAFAPGAWPAAALASLDKQTYGHAGKCALLERQ